MLFMFSRLLLGIQHKLTKTKHYTHNTKGEDAKYTSRNKHQNGYTTDHLAKLRSNRGETRHRNQMVDAALATRSMGARVQQTGSVQLIE